MSQGSGNYYRDMYVLCPFYDKGASHFIQCEGLKDTTAVKLLFYDEKGNAVKEKRNNFAKRYCECDYKSCQIYQLLISKYDEVRE